MRVAGVREFRIRATEFLKGDEVIFITRHGGLSSIVVPLERPQAIPVELRRELLERIGGAVSLHLKRIGVSENRVLRDFQSWRKKRRADRRGR